MPRTLPSALVMPAMLAMEPLGLASGVAIAGLGAVAEGNLAVGLKVMEGVFVGEVVALAVGYGDAQDLSLLEAVGEGGCAFDPEVGPLAPVAQMVVAHEDAGQQASLA